MEEKLITGVNHAFKVGYTYHLSAISNEDAAQQNWHGATPLGTKYPIIKDGSWFVRNGWNTVGDFFERGRDDAGKTFRADKKFLLTIQVPPNNQAEYVHCGQFAKQAPAQSYADGYAVNGLNGLHNGGAAVVSPQQRKRFSAEMKEQMAIAGHSQAVIAELSQNAKETRETLQQQISRLQKQNEALIAENSTLRADNAALKNQNFLLEQAKNQLESSIEDVKKRLQDQYEQMKKDWKAEQEKIQKIEAERNRLEQEAIIAEVVREKRKEWIKELQEKDEGLADEIYQEVKDELRAEWRELEDAQYRFKREKEEFEKKRGLADKGLSLLGEFAATAEGKVAAKAGLAVLSGLTNALAGRFFRSEYQSVNEQYAAAEEAALREQERAQEQERQRAQAAKEKNALETAERRAENPAANSDDDDKLIPTTNQKPEGYEF